MDHRKVDWEKMTRRYNEVGIKPVHFPIHDFSHSDIRKKVAEGAEILNSLITDDKLTVYVHCTAGMGRAPAVVVAYLMIHKGMTLDEAYDYVHGYR